jgi:hypothetical protein
MKSQTIGRVDSYTGRHMDIHDLHMRGSFFQLVKNAENGIKNCASML